MDWTSETSDWTSPDKTLSSSPPPPLSFRGLKGLSAGTVIKKEIKELNCKFPWPWGPHCLVILFLYLHPFCALVTKEEAPPEHCVTTVKMAV